MFEYQFGTYILDVNYVYLPTSLVLLLLCILSFLVGRESRKFSHKNHSFPAVGFTSLIGGFLFLSFHVYEVKPGYTLPILGSLCVVLVGIWIAARLIYPPPKKVPKIIKAKSRLLTDADIPAISELELVDLTELPEHGKGA